MKRILISITILLSVNAMFAQGGNFRIAQEQPVTAKAASEKIHIVTKGETLYSISRKYDVPVNEIKSVNQLTGASINPGQRLYIGQVTPSSSTANARVAGTSTNPGMRTASGTSTSSNDMYAYYVIKKGDDIFSISDNKEISVASLKDMNPEASFVIGERIITGIKPAPAISTPATSNARVAYQPPSANARMASTSLPSSNIYRSTQAAAARMQSQTEPVQQQPVTSVRAKTGEVYEMPAFNVYGQVAMQARYGEVADSRVNSTRFYAYHKTLPLGTKLNLLIPDNAGYLEIEVVGRLDPNSTADIGLSPACVNLIEGASKNDIVTITYN